jgi:hypothetical protein
VQFTFFNEERLTSVCSILCLSGFIPLVSSNCESLSHFLNESSLAFLCPLSSHPYRIGENLNGERPSSDTLEQEGEGAGMRGIEVQWVESDCYLTMLPIYSFILPLVESLIYSFLRQLVESSMYSLSSPLDGRLTLLLITHQLSTPPVADSQTDTVLDLFYNKLSTKYIV